MVKRYLEKAGFPEHTAHSLRHSYATILIGKGTDIYRVKELLRHKSLSSTGIYKHLSQKLKKKTIDEVFK